MSAQQIIKLIQTADDTAGAGAAGAQQEPTPVDHTVHVRVLGQEPRGGGNGGRGAVVTQAAVVLYRSRQKHKASPEMLWTGTTPRRAPEMPWTGVGEMNPGYLK